MNFVVQKIPGGNVACALKTRRKSQKLFPQRCVVVFEDFTNTHLYTLEIDNHVCLVKTRVISSSQDRLQDSANLLMFLIKFLLPSDRSFVVLDGRGEFLSELCPAFFELCDLFFHFLEFLLGRGA